MGDRGQVLIKDTGVYLYTHWGASALEKVVMQAIAKKWRWNDEEYLTRIIFDEMTKGQRDQETGFGIGTGEHGDIWKLVTVNCKDQTVTLRGEDGWTKTFEEINKEVMAEKI